MKKIPTLFIREFPERNKVIITKQVTPGCEWALTEGVATRKYDGSCCAIIDGVFYKRYDAKKGKKPPEGAIPCQPEADPITGHFPHWIEVDISKKEDKWFIDAYDTYRYWHFTKYGTPELEDGTYEAVGTHFNANKDGISYNTLIKHGIDLINPEYLDKPYSFDGIKSFLGNNEIEGIVFYRDNGEMCKIKRSDFGFEW